MKRFCIVMLATLFSQAVLAGGIYKSYDENGTPIYSDKRPKNDHEVVSSPLKKKRWKSKEPEAQEPIASSRTMDSVQDTTNSIAHDVNRVYTELLKKDKTLQGKVGVGFVINKEGKVTRCDEDETAMSKPTFGGRICEIFKTLQYGLVESDKSLNVNFTYSFTPPVKKRSTQRNK